MRPAVVALVKLGPMPDDTATVETIARYERAVRDLEPPASDEEARALLDVLPRDDNKFFGLAWWVLNYMETAPGWPDAGALDDRGWWVTFLRERCERAGLLPRT